MLYAIVALPYIIHCMDVTESRLALLDFHEGSSSTTVLKPRGIRPSGLFQPMKLHKDRTIEVPGIALRIRDGI